MSGILDNVEIEQLCSKLGIKLNCCCSKDYLQHIKPQNGGYIINLQSSIDGGGTHWTALFIRNKDAMYYDSFGIIYPKEIRQFCSNIYIDYNCNEVQNINDEHCGYFAIAFLYFMQHSNDDLNTAMAKYNDKYSDSDSKSNLKSLQNYFKQILKK